jgi:hypothetical protein
MEKLKKTSYLGLTSYKIEKLSKKTQSNRLVKLVIAIL